MAKKKRKYVLSASKMFDEAVRLKPRTVKFMAHRWVRDNGKAKVRQVYLNLAELGYDERAALFWDALYGDD